MLRCEDCLCMGSWRCSRSVQKSTVVCMQGSGLGVQLASRPAQLRSWRVWIWSFLRPQQDVVLARFPLSIAITPNSVTSQPGTACMHGHLKIVQSIESVVFLMSHAHLSVNSADERQWWCTGTGPTYLELLESGACDERLLIMLFLVVEKLRGEVDLVLPLEHIIPIFTAMYTCSGA